MPIPQLIAYRAMRFGSSILVRFVRENAFIFALLTAVITAFIVPELGENDGPLKAGIISQLGVMIIFFLQGLSLNTAQLLHGVRNIRLHGFVQLWIFVITPMILVPAGITLQHFASPALGAGFFFLALVPTTVSSAVAFSSAANGNVAGAIFNTTLSNVIGVFWVPIGCVLVFATTGSANASMILTLLSKLAWLILLPLVLGSLLRPVVIPFKAFSKAKPYFKIINHGIILFIVFAAFSQSVMGQTWKAIPAASLLLLVLMTLMTAILIHALVWQTSGTVLGVHGDRVTALFCGSQKTLAAGAPMAVAIFGNGEYLGQQNVSLVLLPLLCYHPIQLLIAGLLLPRFAHRKK